MFFVGDSVLNLQVSFLFFVVFISCIPSLCRIIILAAACENRIFAYAKTKGHISFAVTATLISAFVFATRIVQLPFYL